MPWCLVHSALKGFHPNEFQSDIRRCTLRRNFEKLTFGGLYEYYSRKLYIQGSLPPGRGRVRIPPP
jgi:hypothetical protein